MVDARWFCWPENGEDSMQGSCVKVRSCLNGHPPALSAIQLGVLAL